MRRLFHFKNITVCSDLDCCCFIFVGFQPAGVILLVVLVVHNVQLMEASVSVTQELWDVSVTPVIMDTMDFLQQDVNVSKQLTFCTCHH